MSNDGHDLDYLNDESPDSITGFDEGDEDGYEADEDFGIEMEAEPRAEFAEGASAQETDHGPSPFGRRKTDIIPEEKPRPRFLRAVVFVLGFGTFAAVSVFLFFGGLNHSKTGRSRVTDFSPVVASKGTAPQVIPFAANNSPAPAPQARPMPVPAPAPVVPSAPYPPQYQQQPVQSVSPVAAVPPQGVPYPPQQVAQAQQPPMPAPVATAPVAQVQPAQQVPAGAMPGQAQSVAPQAAPVSDGPRVAAVPIPSPAQATQNDEILKQLREIKEGLKTTTCESEEEKAAPVADTEAVKSLEKDRAFLLQTNRDLLTKNNFLRQEERKYRLRTQELEAKLKKLEKAPKKDRADAKAPAPAPARVDKAEVAPAPVKTGGPALPAGWEIRGLVSNFVSLENKTRQESQLLEVGDEIEGVRILGINVAKNLVITSNGVAEAKF